MNVPGKGLRPAGKAAVFLVLSTLCATVESAESCCRCSNGREETIAVPEADARATCADICVRQSIMDQRIEVEHIAAGICRNNGGQPPTDGQAPGGTAEH